MSTRTNITGPPVNSLNAGNRKPTSPYVYYAIAFVVVLSVVIGIVYFMRRSSKPTKSVKAAEPVESEEDEEDQEDEEDEEPVKKVKAAKSTKKATVAKRLDDVDDSDDEGEVGYSDPNSFANKSFSKLGTWRINPMKSGYEYRQFFVKDLPNAVKECEAACKNDSLCPGFSVDWHNGNNVNCMVYQANSGKGSVPSCKNKPFKGCTHGVRGKPDVTEGGTWWRGP
jgi:hypothetical protein